MGRREQRASWWRTYVTGADDSIEYLRYLDVQAHLIRDLTRPTGLLLDIEISSQDSELKADFRRAPDDEPFEWTVAPGWWSIRIPGGFTRQESVDGPGETDLDPEWTQWYIDLVQAYFDGSWRYAPLRAGILGRRRVTGVRLSLADRDSYVELGPDGAGLLWTQSTGP